MKKYKLYIFILIALLLVIATAIILAFYWKDIFTESALAIGLITILLVIIIGGSLILWKAKK